MSLDRGPVNLEVRQGVVAAPEAFVSRAVSTQSMVSSFLSNIATGINDTGLILDQVTELLDKADLTKESIGFMIAALSRLPESEDLTIAISFLEDASKSSFSSGDHAKAARYGREAK